MIVGLAGHVDHGKTALVRALTGVDTDHLKEEKARGITIDLGFAYRQAAGGATIGFVDMPGHESLVRTMVAGAAGIDFALLAVAADEGLKPQTREHLDILDLLGIAHGAIAITKSDRADEDRLAAVTREVAAALARTSLAQAPILPVSVRSGAGLDRLGEILDLAAGAPRPVPDDRVFRLAVDRVFTLKGSGTVVAGTASAGQVSVGDEVTIMPGGHRARVRSLHVQNRAADVGRVGDRCALALTGLARDAVARGAWVCGEERPRETTRFDTALRLVASETRGLGPWTPVHFHCGASDVPARVVPLAAEKLAPGARGFAQIVTAVPLPLRHGDRFVLRDTSARRTIGGGTILDPRAPPRHRRAPERLQRLEAMSLAAPDAALPRLLDIAPFFENLDEFAADRGLPGPRAATLAAGTGLVVEGGGPAPLVLTRARQAAIESDLFGRLEAHHAAHPELPGLAGERLRTSCEPKLAKPLFDAVRSRLVHERRLSVRGPWLHLPTHVTQLGADEKRIAELALPLIDEQRFRPPRVRDIGALIAVPEAQVRRACKALVRTGDLVEIATDHFFRRETVRDMAEIARELTSETEGGRFTASAFRDRLDNGRKVAIQILEYFDRHGFTHRAGDLRRAVKSPDAVFGPPKDGDAVD